MGTITFLREKITQAIQTDSVYRCLKGKRTLWKRVNFSCHCSSAPWFFLMDRRSSATYCISDSKALHYSTVLFKREVGLWLRSALGPRQATGLWNENVDVGESTTTGLCVYRHRAHKILRTCLRDSQVGRIPSRLWTYQNLGPDKIQGCAPVNVLLNDVNVRLPILSAHSEPLCFRSHDINTSACNQVLKLAVHPPALPKDTLLAPFPPNTWGSSRWHGCGAASADSCV